MLQNDNVKAGIGWHCEEILDARLCEGYVDRSDEIWMLAHDPGKSNETRETGFPQLEGYLF